MAARKKTDPAAELEQSEDVQDAPARSEVLPGGGVAVGAILHVALPLAGPAPNTQVVSAEDLSNLASALEGASLTLASPASFPLSDGGFATCSSVEVVHQAEPGRVVVKVIG